MYDTENPVPRNGEGRRRRPTAAFRNIGVGAGALGAGAGVGYAGYKVGKAAEDWRKSSPAFVGRAVKTKAKGAVERLLAKLPHAQAFIHRHFLEARLREIRLAAGEYARRNLPDEPLLARKGEPGYDPNVEREVKAALTHRRQKPLTPEQEARVGRRLRKEATTLKSGYAKMAVATGEKKRFMPLVQIFNPFKKIRAGMSAQKAGLTHVPKPGEPPPPEMLPKYRSKTPVRGGEYEGVSTDPFWNPEEAAKESKITYMYPERKHPHQRPPLSPHEVSVKAREYRDPIASHYARVKAGLTESMVVKREKPIMGLPSRYLPRAQEVEEQRQAQALRDYLAGRLRSQRAETITPLRAQARKEAGRAPLKPLGKTKIAEIRSASEAMGDLPIAEGTPFRKPGIREGIPIGGKRVHPAVVQRAQKELHSAVATITSAHSITAAGIKKNIHDRLREHFAKAQHGKLLRSTADRLTNDTFSHNRTSIEDWEVKALAEHTGTKPAWIQRQHDKFVRHTHLGTTQAGEDKIRRAVTHRVFSGIPMGGGPGGPVKASYPILGRLGKRTAIGAGIAGALGIGAYGAHKIEQRRRLQETRFAVPGAVRRIQSKLKGWRVGKVGRHELILGGALAGGITAADALTSAVYPDPDKTRGQSAWAGARRGAVYGTALAGAEPLIRIPLSKRFKMAAKLKEIRFKNKDNSFVRDVAVGGIEGGVGYLATDRLLKRFAPKTTGGKFAAAAAVGGLATGTIGYGLNRLLRAKRNKENPTLMAAKLREIRFQDWADIPSPGRRGRRLTVAQDRYKKVIREREIQRKESNLAKSALAGAALAGAVSHKTRIPLKRSLAIGAVGGLGAQTALLLRGRKTRDPYGEESIASKRIERLPYQVGGVATAGVLGHRLYKHLKLDSKGRLIRFQQFIPADTDTVPWHVKEASRWIKHPQTRVEHAQKWIGRAQRIHRDINLPRNAQGKVVDERGRVRQPEWKKDWFKRSIYGGAAVGTLLGAAVLHRRIKASAVTAAGLMEKGLAPTQGERLALNIASGNVARAGREMIRSKFPRFVRGTKALGGLGQELKQAKENILARANVAVEGKTGRITKASIKRSKKGDIIGVDVENPAQAREHLAKIQAEEEKMQRRAEQLRRQREKVKRTQGTRGTLERIVAPPPEEGLSSKVKTIHFDEVYVRPHTRSARRQKYRTERKDWREGFLIGGGIGLGGLGVGGGLAYRKKFTEQAEARLAKRVAQELSRVRPLKHLSAKLDAIISFK